MSKSLTLSSLIIIEPVLSVNKINSNNHIYYAPFKPNNELVYVDKEWWNSLSNNHKNEIKEYFGEDYGYCVRNNIQLNENKLDSKAFYQMFNAYINSYSIAHWHYCFDQPYYITSMEQNIIDNLLVLYKKCGYKNRTLTMEDLSFYPKNIINSINKFISEHIKTGVFMKMSDTSGKHQSIITPKYSFEEIITEIVHNKNMIQSIIRYGTKSVMFLTPWNYEINDKNEFRVFINNRFITSISQQKCYKYVGLTNVKVRKYTESIISLYNKIKKNIMYKSCVLDVWVDQNLIAHLIEINPGEMWSSSGSSLFHWENDYKKLYQTKNIYVRYIDIQSPLVMSRSPVNKYLINKTIPKLDLNDDDISESSDDEFHSID